MPIVHSSLKNYEDDIGSFHPTNYNPIFTNPFYLYIFTWGIVFCTYALGWSDLYPPLSIDIVLFFILTFFISLISGFIVRKEKVYQGEYIVFSKKKVIYNIIFIIISATSEFIVAGGVPLLMIVSGADYKYNEFGIPTFHVFFVTYLIFISLLSYQIFLISRRSLYLWIPFLAIIFYLLIFSRGSALNVLVPMAILYLIHRPVSRKYIQRILIGCLLLLYVFGVMGNYRFFASHPNVEYSNDLILSIGDASSSFRDSFIPKEYFWSYLYISSPLSNLVYSEQLHDLDYVDIEDLGYCVFTGVVPDFISKRVIQGEVLSVPKTPLVTDALNVSSMYGSAVAAAGLYGLMIMYILWWGFTAFFIYFFKRSVFYYVVIAILGVVAVMGSFANMITFSGASFSLFYCFVFSIRRFRKILLE